jgi:hypothetical protein
LKEGGAVRCPRLLCHFVARSSDVEQDTGERMRIERIGPSRDDQRAELLDLARLTTIEMAGYSSYRNR